MIVIHLSKEQLKNLVNEGLVLKLVISESQIIGTARISSVESVETVSSTDSERPVSAESVGSKGQKGIPKPRWKENEIDAMKKVIASGITRKDVVKEFKRLLPSTKRTDNGILKKFDRMKKNQG